MVALTTLLLLGTIFLFLAGIGIGLLFSRRRVSSNSTHLQVAVGIMVTIVWVVSIVAEIIIPAYTASLLIHGIMGAVVGYLFSSDGFTINIGGE